MPFLGEKIFSSTGGDVVENNGDQYIMPIDWTGTTTNSFEDETKEYSNPPVSIDGKVISFEVVSETSIDNTKPLKVIMLKGEKGDPGTPGSAGDYETLINKPKINSNVLVGDKTLEELGAQYLIKLTNSEIEALLT